MIRISDILDKVTEYNPEADMDLIDRAYIFSAKVHDGQVRLSGEPYLSHPLEVASILADMKLDRNGTKVYVDVTATFISAGGDPLVYVTFKDVTERREFETSLSRLAKSYSLELTWSCRAGVRSRSSSNVM